MLTCSMMRFLTFTAGPVCLCQCVVLVSCGSSWSVCVVVVVPYAVRAVVAVTVMHVCVLFVLHVCEL